jgi:hypothetical protein
MRELSTGEPYALVAHVRFGGRGGLTAIPTPIERAWWWRTSAAIPEPQGENT